MTHLLAAALSLVALAVPPAAVADDGSAPRVRAPCAGGRAELRLRLEDRRIAVELRLDARRPQTLRIVLLHERTLVFDRPVRTGRSRALRLRWRVDDWAGREAVTARIGTPTGHTCVLEASI